MKKTLRTSKLSLKNVLPSHYSDKNNPEALSQLYKMMNYKPTSNKGEKLTTEQVANFLKVNKKNEGDVYDDIMYYDDAKIKVNFFIKVRNWFWDKHFWLLRDILIQKNTSRQSRLIILMTKHSITKSDRCLIDLHFIHSFYVIFYWGKIQNIDYRINKNSKTLFSPQESNTRKNDWLDQYA